MSKYSWTFEETNEYMTTGYYPMYCGDSMPKAEVIKQQYRFDKFVETVDFEAFYKEHGLLNMYQAVSETLRKNGIHNAMIHPEKNEHYCDIFQSLFFDWFWKTHEYKA